MEIWKRLVTNLERNLLLAGTFLLPWFALPFASDRLNLPKQLLLFSALLLIIFVALARAAISKELAIRQSNFDIWLLLLLGFIVISTLLSFSPAMSFWGRNDIFVLDAASFTAWMLWCWFLVQFVRERRDWSRFLSALLLSGLIAGLYFLAQSFSWWRPVAAVIGTNPVSGSVSAFGVYMAIVGVLALGLTLGCGRRPLMPKLLSLVALVVSLFSLVRVGFAVPWIVFTVGLGLLLALGLTRVSAVRIDMLLVVFVLFLFSLGAVFFGIPNRLKQSLPVEISLGSKASWDIVRPTILASTKAFLFGTGPGTFGYDFSLHRSPVFNTALAVAAPRFFQPYNTWFALGSELGVVGALALAGVMLTGLGVIWSVWSTAGFSLVQWYLGLSASRQPKKPKATDGALAVLVVGVAWLVVSLGMIFVFYESVLWWLWWWLLGILIAGSAPLVPRLAREKSFVMRLPRQYALLAAFVVILALSGLIFFAVVKSRHYRAEVSYGKAAQAGNLDTRELYLRRAITDRPAYARYHLELAGLYLERARLAAQTETHDPDQLGALISEAVNEARRATDQDPHSVEAWQTLGIIYMNARPVLAEANNWAREALSQAIALEPAEADLHVRLGNVHEFAGRAKEAEAEYRQAISLHPKLVSAYISLASLYEKQNKLDEAIKFFEPILVLIEDNPELVFYLGRLFYNRNGAGDNQRAEVAWLRAAQLKPDYVDALYGLGLLYERLGQRGRAIEYVEKAQRLTPQNDEARRKLESLRQSTVNR